ncbi:MAG: ribosome recycling factor [Candidatus Gygaella obscura]|nr:ribosome recycling factor [Candidatus Gygaella obscura]
MSVKEVIKKTEDNMKKAIVSCAREFNTVRTGRASPSLVEGLHIDYYGTPTLLKQLANISVPDARLIVIQPWDLSAIAEIEKAIFSSNLGITPSNDGKVVRLAVPPLSDERREELVKVIKQMVEETRVSVRTIRRDANESVKKLESEKVISEDEKFKSQDQIQKLTNNYIAEADKLLENKEKELKQF